MGLIFFVTFYKILTDRCLYAPDDDRAKTDRPNWKRTFPVGQQRTREATHGIEKMPEPGKDQPKEKNQRKNGELSLHLSLIFPI